MKKIIIPLLFISFLAGCSTTGGVKAIKSKEHKTWAKRIGYMNSPSSRQWDDWIFVNLYNRMKTEGRNLYYCDDCDFKWPVSIDTIKSICTDNNLELIIFPEYNITSDSYDAVIYAISSYRGEIVLHVVDCETCQESAFIEAWGDRTNISKLFTMVVATSSTAFAIGADEPYAAFAAPFACLLDFAFNAETIEARWQKALNAALDNAYLSLFNKGAILSSF